MRQRILAVWVLLAAAVPGLLFAPVFGLTALVAPIAVVLVACYAVVELCLRVSSLQPWRPVLAIVVGLVGLTEVALFDTTLGGLPTVDSLRALLAGVTDSWQLTLQSTWPVRPDSELLLFVPLLVLIVAVVGLELLRWPAAAVLPSLAFLVLSQAFVAVSGVVMIVAAVGYTVVAAGLFMARSRSSAVLVVPTLVLGVVAGVVLTAVDERRQPAYSLQQNQSAHVSLPRTVSPLTEVAARLEKPDAPVFSYTSDAPVDRWRLVVLAEFNGVTWAATDQYRRLGAEIGPQAEVTVPTTSYSARLQIPAAEEPWVPSQSMPASVNGVAPLIDQATGTLLLPDRAGPVEYDLRWWEPTADLDGLADAALSTTVTPGDLGAIPPGIADLAQRATGGARPSFRTALVLEQYLSQNYRVATGSGLPTGSGWPQLRDFLLESKRGTSEQFAASYVALARIVGIPARLAVGYRAPRTPVNGRMQVRNADVLAWPEVAVAGVGWVPLDPVGAASGAGPAPSRLAQLTAKARAALPPPTEMPDPPLPPEQPEPVTTGGIDVLKLVLLVVLGLLVLGLLAIVAIPVVKVIRTMRRKRLSGTPGVVAAWWEARDLLRAYGTQVTPGMTARDLAAVVDGSVVDGLHRLAGQMDTALWSGAGANDSTVAAAWNAVGDIRRTLAARPLVARIKAVFAIR
jgi:protein-glutamine gamma-glutamyltransferase